MDEPPEFTLIFKISEKELFFNPKFHSISGYFLLPVIKFQKFYFSYKSDVSEFGINGKGTGGTVSG